MIDSVIPYDIEQTSEETAGHDTGLAPGVEASFVASKRTRQRQAAAGDFYKGDALQEIARYGGYSVYNPPGNTDPWVREALKLFSRQDYDNAWGFTRRGEGTDGMYKSLMKFDTPRNRFSDLSPLQQSAMRASIGKAYRRFKLPVKHEPLDWHEVGQYMRTDTSAGATFMGKRKGECMSQIYTEARWLGHRMKQGGKCHLDPRQVRMPPCLAGQRGHMSPRDEPKTRLVWVYPAEMLVIEGLWAPVMYREFEQLPDSPLLYGKSSQRLFTEWIVGKKEGEVLHGLDFSGFDNSVPTYLIHAAFDILRQNVEWFSWRGRPTTKRSQQKWRNVWDGMKWYFINTPILMPDGRMFRKHGGVPSGSWFTQLIDSVVNYIVVDYLAAMQAVTVRGLRVLGDDSGFRSPQTMDLVRASADAHPLGMTLNVKKCEITREPTEFKLLGTRYRSGHAHREDSEWWKLALYPENPPGDVGVSLSRLVGLWIGGAMWSKAFSKFLEFFQTCYLCPSDGWFAKDQRRWLEIIYGNKAPRGWTAKKSLFWRAIFYTL